MTLQLNAPKPNGRSPNLAAGASREAALKRGKPKQRRPKPKMQDSLLGTA
jgi:hypothetical protein